jgi:Ala-tRNA(Pro) deacylase
MAATPDELFSALDRLGIAHPTVSHQPLFTVEQSQSLRGSIAGGHTRTCSSATRRARCFSSPRWRTPRSS